MGKGKISVIVPCYNVENYIRKTIYSILAQTYKNIEIIIVDDGSTDETKSIIDQLAQDYDNVRSFHKNNGGVSSARLYGINHSSGEWLTFVDGDDLLKPEMYEVLIDNAMRFNADISHCGYEMVFPDCVDKHYGTQKIVLQSNFEGQKDLLSGKFVEPSLCNKLYKRQVVLDSKEECTSTMDICYTEDLLWNYYFFKRAKRAIFIDECFYQYVLRKGSAVTSPLNRHKLLDPLRVCTIIEKDLSNPDELKRLIKNRKVAKLIGIATMEKESKIGWEVDCSERAKAVLRKNVIKYWRGPFSMRIKGMILLASISPGLYMKVHRIYATYRGTNRKQVF